jgi:hypothetical protein
LLNRITERTPVEKIAVHLESFHEEVEFLVTEWQLGDAHSTAELRAGDFAQAQFVKVAKELTHTDAEFFDLCANFGKHVLKVIRLVVTDESALEGRSLEVGKRFQMFLRNFDTY